MKIEELKKAIAEVTEPRRPYGNIRHKLTDIIILGLCTVICGGEDFNDMETFGLEREEWLKSFLELRMESRTVTHSGVYLNGLTRKNCQIA